MEINLQIIDYTPVDGANIHRSFCRTRFPLKYYCLFSDEYSNSSSDLNQKTIVFKLESHQFRFTRKRLYIPQFADKSIHRDYKSLYRHLHINSQLTSWSIRMDLSKGSRKKKTHCSTNFKGLAHRTSLIYNNLQIVRK